jgi:hypothetical protein
VPHGWTMDRSPANSSRHMHCLQAGPAVFSHRPHLWQALLVPGELDTSCPKDRSIHLLSATMPPHGQATADPGCPPIIPNYIHSQGPLRRSVAS